MENKQLIEELKALGFNEYKAKVLITLTSGKIMSASEIVKRAKIVRGSIYDILKSFVQKGYCNEIETNTVLQYQMVDPDIILDKIIKDSNEMHNSLVNQFQTAFQKLKSNYLKENADEDKQINIELIRGFNKHRVSKYKQFLLSAKNEICNLYNFKGLVSTVADSLAVKFIKSGGVIRSVYNVSLDFKIAENGKFRDAKKDDLIKVCKNFEKYGEQIRLSIKDIPNMTITDNENVFINNEDKHIPRHSHADIIFRNSKFSKYMKDLFEFYWNDSLTLEAFINKK
jgi:HTH-type transcriptional regulator, sugar sensing transcriptional regulator